MKTVHNIGKDVRVRCPVKILPICFMIFLISCQDSNIDIGKALSLIGRKTGQSEAKNEIPGFYFLADGTYSTSSEYMVPKLTPATIDSLIGYYRSCSRTAHLWVSFIDNNGKDNDCLYFEIIAPKTTSKRPGANEGGYIKHEKVMADWKLKQDAELRDSINECNAFSKRKSEFISGLTALLNNKVYVRSPRNQFSDVVGSLNSANRMLTDQVELEKITAPFIIGFSDFQNDPPVQFPFSVDSRIRVFNLISQPGASRNSVLHSTEMVSPQDLLKVIIQ